MSRTDLRSAVAKVRRFSRFYTRRVGVLQEAFMDSALSLPEGRVVYEIAQRQQASARDLVTDLDLDPGYLSRLLKGLEGRGFLRRVVSRQDARQHLLTLTPAGHREYDKIDQRAQAEVEDLLAPLAPGQRTNLVHALSTVERLMSGQTHAGNVTFRDLRPGDIGLVISRHGALYTEEYGWYWDSYEPFAWAVYHYGRWGFDPAYNWYWVPGDTWSPAWVQWRYGDQYVGWAPEPPHAYGPRCQVLVTRESSPLSGRGARVA